MHDVIAYQDADRLPPLTSRPVSWWCYLVPEEARNMDRRLWPRLVEELNGLVVLTICICSEVDHVGHVLTSKFWLVRSTGDLVQVFHGQLKIFNMRTLKESFYCSIRKGRFTHFQLSTFCVSGNQSSQYLRKLCEAPIQQVSLLDYATTSLSIE